MPPHAHRKDGLTQSIAVDPAECQTQATNRHRWQITPHVACGASSTVLFSSNDLGAVCVSSPDLPSRCRRAHQRAPMASPLLPPVPNTPPATSCVSQPARTVTGTQRAQPSMTVGTSTMLMACTISNTSSSTACGRGLCPQSRRALLGWPLLRISHAARRARHVRLLIARSCTSCMLLPTDRTPGVALPPAWDAEFPKHKSHVREVAIPCS